MPTRRFYIRDSLTRLMAEHGWNVPEVSRRTHIVPIVIYRYLKGQCANAASVKKIAHMFHVPYDQLAPGAAETIRKSESGSNYSGPPCGVARILEMLPGYLDGSGPIAIRTATPKPLFMHQGKIVG